MLLRASAMTTDTEVDLQGVVGNKTSAATGIAFGAELMHFSESIALRDEKIIAESRKALLAAAGPAVLVDAAGVAANFQRMVRIADSIGIPFDYMDSTMAQGIQQELGLKRFASARHSLKPGVD
jgi:DNA-binding phage protein